MSEKHLNWAVLGTGVIANQMAALSMYSKQPKRAMISCEKPILSLWNTLVLIRKGVVVGLWLVLFFLLLVGGRECRLA